MDYSAAALFIFSKNYGVRNVHARLEVVVQVQERVSMQRLMRPDLQGENSSRGDWLIFNRWERSEASWILESRRRSFRRRWQEISANRIDDVLEQGPPWRHTPHACPQLLNRHDVRSQGYACRPLTTARVLGERVGG